MPRWDCWCWVQKVGSCRATIYDFQVLVTILLLHVVSPLGTVWVGRETGTAWRRQVEGVGVDSAEIEKIDELILDAIRFI